MQREDQTDHGNGLGTNSSESAVNHLSKSVVRDTEGAAKQKPHATFCGNRGRTTAPGDPVCRCPFRDPAPRHKSTPSPVTFDLHGITTHRADAQPVAPSAGTWHRWEAGQRWGMSIVACPGSSSSVNWPAFPGAGEKLSPRRRALPASAISIFRPAQSQPEGPASPGPR